MKVAVLRNELSLRGLLKNGLKAVLVDRLKDAIAKKLPLMSKRPLVEVANTAGDGFQLGVYWEEITADGEFIDKSVMEVNVVSSRAPTTSEAEHTASATFEDQPKKFSFAFDLNPFVSDHALLPKMYDRGKSKGQFKKGRDGKYNYKRQSFNGTTPNLQYLFDNGIGFESHLDFFSKKIENNQLMKRLSQ